MKKDTVKVDRADLAEFLRITERDTDLWRRLRKALDDQRFDALDRALAKADRIFGADDKWKDRG